MTTIMKKIENWFISKFVSLVDSHSAVRNSLLDEPGLEEAFDTFDSRNYSDAFQMFLVSAELGNAAAQYNVGVCYETNSGILQNDSAAEEWYRKAAEQDLGKAQYAFSCLLAGDIMSGNDRHSKEEQDRKMVEEYMWLTIANEQGYSESSSSFKRVAAHMNPEQIEEAEMLAREWIEKRRQ
tara:strand:+ start:122 stop:664 length:543 start_codon:yes stop_codon:yes gene_type:complete